MINKHKDKDDLENEGKIRKINKKKDKKSIKKSKKNEKKERLDKLREEELKKIFESYGNQIVTEKGSNITYIEEKRKEKIKDEEII